MSILSIESRSESRKGARSAGGFWLSVALHATLATAIVSALPMGASETAAAPRRRAIPVFMFPPAQVLALVASIPPPVVRKMVAAPLRSVAAEAPRVIPRTPPSRDEKPAAESPKPIAAAPLNPVAPALVPAAPPVFERPLDTRSFERSIDPRTNDRAAAVATAGFGSAAPQPRTVDRAAAVTAGGFGSATPQARADGANRQDDVRAGGFDLKPRAAAVATQVPKAVDRPVEILFKPEPSYSDEAKRRRIEGTVTLEVEFGATGEIQVLRVVQGLGYGLDEAAEQAVMRIRFKPAQADGRSVNYRATVHITFRIS
jgi:TonB family protein